MTKAHPRKRPKIDHDAVERDYRLGQYTLRELGSMHGCSHQAVAKLAKTGGWSQDLSKVVRAATNASLIQEAVNQAVAKNGQEVASAVQVAAELNKSIILGQRSRLAEVAAVADAAKTALLALLPSVANLRDAATAMAATESWSRVVRSVIDQERVVFKLDDNDGGQPLTRVVMVPQKDQQ
ncbi:hypothetical protein [Rhizobacter fulvus]